MSSPKGSSPGPSRALSTIWLRLVPSTLAPLALAAPDSRKPDIGGQAVLEGVMMRGSRGWSVTVRAPDGSLKTRHTPHLPWTKRRPWLGMPLVRGPVVLIESLILGIKALNYSAEAALAEAPEKTRTEPTGDSNSGTTQDCTDLASQTSSPDPAKPADSHLSSGFDLPPDPPTPNQKNKPAAKRANSKSFDIASIVGSLIGGFTLAIGLFVALPHVLSLMIGRFFSFDEASIWFHLLDGVFKFAFLLAYVWGIGHIKEIRRLYAYHGAEHQAIYVYEAALPLTPEKASAFPTWHPRCGTAFLFLVLALSIVFFAAVFPLFFSSSSMSRFSGALVGVGLKIILMFPLSALAYELTRLASRNNSGTGFKAMIWPGLMLQKLTTRQPDNSQLEVAFNSLKAVMDSPPSSPPLDSGPLAVSDVS